MFVAPGSYSVGASGLGRRRCFTSPDQAALLGCWMWHFIQNPEPMSIYFLAVMTRSQEQRWISGTTPQPAGSLLDSTPMCNVAPDFPECQGTPIAELQT